MAEPFSTGRPLVRGWRSRVLHAIEAPTLGQCVRRRGLVNEQQLAQAIAIQRLSGERLGHVLVRLNYLEETELAHILSRQRLLRWLGYWLG